MANNSENSDLLISLELAIHSIKDAANEAGSGNPPDGYDNLNDETRKIADECWHAGINCMATSVINWIFDQLRLLQNTDHKSQDGGEKVKLSLSKDGWTGGLQFSIGDKNGGYRIAGPKFNGSGKLLLEHTITERDANKIRCYFDRAFPPKTVSK